MAQQGAHIKKLQAKIFRSQAATPADGGSSNNDRQSPKEDGKPARSNSGDSPSLTINIPNSALNDSSQPAHVPPKLRTEPAPTHDESARTFRQRLVDALGTDYHGAERYRLDQDDRKERHWKRWGPYLSDRQWVRRRSRSLLVLSRPHASPMVCIGHCP